MVDIGEAGENIGLGWLVYAGDPNNPDGAGDRIAGGVIVHEGYGDGGTPTFTCVRTAGRGWSTCDLTVDQIVVAYPPEDAVGECRALYRRMAAKVGESRGDVARDIATLRRALKLAEAALR